MTHVHLIGIGGTGISSIARVLLEKGYVVSGSDRTLSPLAIDLQQAGAVIYEGHAAQNIHGADVVVRSSAIADNNVEVTAARALGIPVQKRADFLNTLLREYTVLAVAGSHGKTTTSTMLALTLERLGLQPGFILGGVSRDLGVNARAGGGKYFVIEADEYDYMFLGLEPSLILVTNVEYDHPDCFPTREAYQSAFAAFVGKLKRGGTLVTNSDQPGAAALVYALPADTTSLTYGFTVDSDITARGLTVNPAGGMSFTLHAPYNSPILAAIDLLVPGEHNLRNSLGVLAAHHALGSSLPAAAAAISTYHGSGRRFEIVGEVDGITIIDDYAHHPSKIKATLAAARSRFSGRRLVAVWQPHTYSRTLALEEDFINAFADADLVIVTGIYASREKVQDYSVENLVKRIKHVQALHIESLRDVTQFLARNLQPEDVLLVLSAGDADSVCREVISLLKERKG